MSTGAPLRSFVVWVVSSDRNKNSPPLLKPAATVGVCRPVCRSLEPVGHHPLAGGLPDGGGGGRGVVDEPLQVLGVERGRDVLGPRAAVCLAVSLSRTHWLCCFGMDTFTESKIIVSSSRGSSAAVHIQMYGILASYISIVNKRNQKPRYPQTRP